MSHTPGYAVLPCYALERHIPPPLADFSAFGKHFFFNAYINRGGCKIKYPIIDGGHGNRNTHERAMREHRVRKQRKLAVYSCRRFFLLSHNSTKEATAFTFGRTVGRRSVCQCPPRCIVLKLENVENTRKTEKPIRFGMTRQRFHNVVIIIFF